MQRIFRWLMLISAMALVGCASQRPINFDQAAYSTNKPKSLGVVIERLPQPKANRAGAQGLLDVAINNAMATGLDRHLASLKLDEFQAARQVIARFFSAQGITAKVIDEELDTSGLPKNPKPGKGVSPIDYSSLKQKYGVEQLVVLKVDAAGTIRNYYGFVPLGAPQGYFACSGMLLDLSNNKLLWKKSRTSQISVTDPWDQEAQAYPNVTAAFYRALDAAKTDLLRDLVGTDGVASKGDLQASNQPALSTRVAHEGQKPALQAASE